MNCAALLRPRMCQRSRKQLLTGLRSLLKNDDTGAFNFFSGFLSFEESSDKAKIYYMYAKYKVECF